MRYTPPNPSYRLEDHMHRLMLPGQETYPEHADGQMGGSANTIRSDRNFTNQKSSDEQLHDQRQALNVEQPRGFPKRSRSVQDYPGRSGVGRERDICETS